MAICWAKLLAKDIHLSNYYRHKGLWGLTYFIPFPGLNYWFTLFIIFHSLIVLGKHIILRAKKFPQLKVLIYYFALRFSYFITYSTFPPWWSNWYHHYQGFQFLVGKALNLLLRYFGSFTTFVGLGLGNLPGSHYFFHISGFPILGIPHSWPWNLLRSWFPHFIFLGLLDISSILTLLGGEFSPFIPFFRRRIYGLGSP